MSWLNNDDVTSGTGTGTGSALVNPWTNTSSRAVCSLAFSGNPGTVVPPAEWAASEALAEVTQTGTLFLWTFVMPTDFVAADAGDTYTFTWDNSVPYVASMYAINTAPAVGAYMVESDATWQHDAGSGGPTNWTLPDMTMTFDEPDELTAGCGVHAFSPRAYLRTAGAGSFSTFASTGNGTYEGAFSTGSGLLGLSTNTFVRTDEASLTTGARGLTWSGTASGLGAEQFVKVGRVTDTPLVDPTTGPAYQVQTRRVKARELPYQVNERMWHEARKPAQG